MKKSGKVGLVLIAALGLSSCGRRATPTPVSASEPGTMAWDDTPRDPCSKEYFNDGLCKGAVSNRGYHYGGHWYPMMYSAPYSTYYDNHRSYLSGGGKHTPPPPTVYQKDFVAPPKGTIVRGGFGSTIRNGSAAAGATTHSSSSSSSTHTSSSPSSHSSSSSSAGS